VEWINRRRIKIFTFLVLLVVAGYFFYQVRSVFTPFLIAIVLAYLMHPFVQYLKGKGLSHTQGIIFTYLLLGAILFVLTAFILPIIVQELQDLAVKLPTYAEKARRLIILVNERYSQVSLPAEVRGIMDNGIRRLEGILLAIVSSTINGLINIFSQLVNIVLAPVLAYYFLRDSEQIKEWCANLLPVSYRKEASSVLNEVNIALRSFIRGQMLDNLIVGTLTAIGLMLLGMDYALLLGLIVAIVNTIPYLGPIIGLVVGGGLSLLQSPLLALKVAVLFIVIQQIDGAFLAPRIVGGSVGMHPLLVILALFIGEKLYGILGMLFAVPVAAVLQVLVRYLIMKLST